MRRFVLAILVALALTIGPAITPASACPMCAEANKTDENRPRAYMYSILFMLSMPAVIVTGFGVGLYRLSRKNAEVESHDGFSDPLKF